MGGDKMIYSDKDLQDIVDKKVSINDIAIKYHTSISNVRRAMNKRKYYVNKQRITIKSPYGTKVVDSAREGALELGISIQSVKNALNGKYPRILKELEITLEVYYGEKAETD